MERLLVVVFDDEPKANEGTRALEELDSDGSISVHAAAVVKKNADGSVTTVEFADDFPIRTAEGTAIGAMIGALGGPIGVDVGADTGAYAGYLEDLNAAGVNADYLNEVSTGLTAGKWAVVADVSEESENPVNTKMKTLGGTVFRANREDVETEQYKRDEAELKLEIASLKQEQAQSGDSKKAKIQANIDVLNAKLNLKMQKAKERSQQRKMEMQVKVHSLEEKAKKSKGDTKAKIESRIDSLRNKEAKESAQGQQQQQQQQPVQV